MVAAAAGNDASTTPAYPAADREPGVLAIAVSIGADTLADFSNRGSWIDLAAPGVGILSSVPIDQYGAWSGTSMAMPLAAGAAALVRAANPNLSPAEVAARMTATAAHIRGAVPRRLDAAAALGLSVRDGAS